MRQVGLTTGGQGGRESAGHSLSAHVGSFMMGMVLSSQFQALGTCHGTCVLASGSLVWTTSGVLVDGTQGQSYRHCPVSV